MRWAQENDEEAEEEDDKNSTKKTKNGARRISKKATASAKKTVKNKNKKDAVDKKAEACGAYKAGEYSSMRKKFIRKLQESQSVSYGDASKAWNESQERAGLLAGMSRSELKRRRFI